MKELSDREFFVIRDYIKEKTGINLNDTKKTLIYSRLHAEIEKLGFKSFDEYFKHIKSEDSQEHLVSFIDKITTNHTYFMRESDHFDYFREAVLPWLEQTAKGDVRLWCAASSSGEEPYTLEMILMDYFGSKANWNTEILATDISSRVLDKAVKGVYKAEDLAGLPNGWLKHYFQKNDERTFMVRDEIKQKVYYRRFNLMDEKLPFKKPFQVIFCRNVMIYFDTPTRDALVSRFANALEPDGWLFVGHSEVLGASNQNFSYVKPAVYRKVSR